MKLNYKDVTMQGLKTSCSNFHEVKIRDYYEHDGVKYFVDGKKVVLDYSLYEKKIAEWLCILFGGDIYLLPRINEPKGIRTSDYLYNDEYWDLKKMSCNAISKKRAVDNIIKKSKFQTENIILDISDSILSEKLILKQVKKLYTTSGREWLKCVLIVKNFELIKIFVRK